MTGSKVSTAGEGMNRTIIPTPTWRKIGEMDSDARSASTFVADGKMGRSRPVPMVPMNKYAMGAPRTNMSHCMTTWDCNMEVESSGLDDMHEVSLFCYSSFFNLY